MSTPSGTHTQSTKNMSRAMRLEAKIAAENAKKMTIARAPAFASDARAKRRYQADTPSSSTFMSPRRIV